MKFNLSEVVEKIENFSSNTINLWVCDYERKFRSTKTLRNLKPTLAEICLICERSKIKTIRVTVKGKSKQIPTSSTTGRTISFFENYEECRNYFNSLIFQELESIKREKASFVEEMESEEQRLEKMFIDTDYLMEKMTVKKGD